MGYKQTKSNRETLLQGAVHPLCLQLTVAPHTLRTEFKFTASSKAQIKGPGRRNPAQPASHFRSPSKSQSSAIKGGHKVSSVSVMLNQSRLNSLLSLFRADSKGSGEPRSQGSVQWRKSCAVRPYPP